MLMEDLLKEIKSLSSRLEESQSDSNSTSEVGGDQSRPPGIGLDLLQMRNKSKSKRRRGRKRRLESHPELETGSESSFVDSSDEEVARDYCENITSKTNVTDSDEEFVPVRKCLTLPKGVPWSPLDFGESDSYSENIMNFNARRKRKIKKINKKFKALEKLDKLSVPSKKGQIKEKEKKQRREQENDEHIQCDNVQFNSYKRVVENCDDDEFEDDDDDEMMEGSDVTSEEETDEGDSENSSSGSNEADDEGEESCIETNIPSVIPFWEDEKMYDDKETEDFQIVLSQSFKLLSDESKRGNF